MPTSKALAHRARLDPADRQWLVSFVREWHLLADTSFSDLVLWLPGEDDHVFWAVAQVRPTTGPTALEDDVIGEDISYDPESLVTQAYLTGQICQTSDNKLQAGIPVDVCAIPILRKGRVIAVVERHTNQMGVRAPGALEDTYLEAAAVLANMAWRGEFPLEPPSDPSLSPRVGDGMVLISREGLVRYASPNAVSAARHLGVVGDVMGETLKDLIHSVSAELIPIEPELAPVAPFTEPAEFTYENDEAAIRLRYLPLTMDDEPAGALLLCRDVTPVRERERQLVTKDATIREIHHRVKNNLQTVAALLRLQSRRMHSQEARAALDDAMHRVQSIATVHEILSQSFQEAVQFDDVADRILSMVADVASAVGTVHARREGSFGLVQADTATALSLVMTELCQNAIEHGLLFGGGNVVVRPTRRPGMLILDVVDDGEGLPEGFDLDNTDSLGLSIVRTLVADLNGTFELTNDPSGIGARARVSVPTR